MEKIGIGIDIENVNRFKNIKSNARLLDNIFTEKEKIYCLSKKNSFSHFAVRFSGKEAVIKALCSMGQVPLNYKEIEIINDKNGVPTVKLCKKNYDKFETKITLSHCEDKVVAFSMVINRSFYGEKN